MLNVLTQRTVKYALQELNRRLKQRSRKANVKYFAYGANMDGDLLRKKSVFPAESTPAKLNGYQVEISSPCEWQGKGFASISAQEGAEVYGVIYAVTEVDLAILDLLEWVPFNFHRRIKVVVSPIDGREPVEAWAYVAKHPTPGLKTSRGYRDLLARSAKELALPAAYVEQLESLPVADAFALDHGFRLSNPGKRRWMEQQLSPLYRVHDEWREKICKLLP